MNRRTRTTVEFDPDVEAAIKRLRTRVGARVGEVVNGLIRRGLAAEPPVERFEVATHDLGLRIDVSNVADALDLLGGPEAR